MTTAMGVYIVVFEPGFIKEIMNDRTPPSGHKSPNQTRGA